MHHCVWPRPEEVMVGLSATAPGPPCAVTSHSVDSGVRQMMAMDLRSYLPDDILVKVDRASMSVGLNAGLRCSIIASWRSRGAFLRGYCARTEGANTRYESCCTRGFPRPISIVASKGLRYHWDSGCAPL